LVKLTATGDQPMNQNAATTTQVPLHILLRRRRQELSLLQVQIAEALHVTPECVGQWESGHRRMELSKIPRIAEALQMDAKELCVKALAEFHPLVYATLFGKDLPAKIQQATV
jgi:transcriptional regulator with XRE-family HTH domain